MHDKQKLILNANTWFFKLFLCVRNTAYTLLAWSLLWEVEAESMKYSCKFKRDLNNFKRFTDLKAMLYRTIIELINTDGIGFKLQDWSLRLCFKLP